MVSLAFWRRCSRDSHSSCRIMSVGELMLWYRLNTNRAARRWTFSMLLVYFIIEYGSHTGEQYSSMGLTSPLYAVSLTCVVLILRFLWRNASCLFALSQVLLMWAAQVRSPESSTPRYVAFSTLSNIWLCRVYGYSIFLCFLVMAMVLHLAALKDIHHLFSQFSRLSRSSCKMVQS